MMKTNLKTTEQAFDFRDIQAQRGAIPDQVNATARVVVDSAFKVHSSLGPGLLESVYKTCLKHELMKRGCSVEHEQDLPVLYDGIQVDVGFRLDLIVENCVIIEVKAVETIIPIYHAQLLTYLKLTGHRLGLLINFNVQNIGHSIKRIAL